MNAGDDSRTTGAGAASEALSALQKKQASAEPTLALVFASSTYNQSEVLAGVRMVVGDTCHIAGASTAGEITNAGPIKRNSVVVLLLATDVPIETAVANDVTGDSYAAGVAVATALKNSLPEALSLILMFGDGLKGNGSAIIRGMLSVVGETFPIAGGSAGDNGKFVATHQYHDTTVHTESVVGVGFGSNLKFSVGVNHGWTAVGMPQIVTKATGTKIYTLNDQPAFALYESYLGIEGAKNLRDEVLGEVALSYPLGIRVPNSNEMLLRAPFGVAEDGSITCGGEVPEGSEVQLMVGTKEDAVKAATTAALSAKNGLSVPPAAAIIFSCHVRNTLYANSDAAKAEIDAIQAVIGADVPLAGFYTYAEQAPVGGMTHNIHSCNPEFHNETIVIVLLGSE